MTTLRDDVVTWRDSLLRFLEPRAVPAGDPSDLDARQHWQRRITGGVLVQFFELLEHSRHEEHFPALKSQPLPERLFLFITDVPGLIAGRELMNTDTDQALIVLKDHWRAFLETPGEDPDEDFRRHYEFWSVWHQELPQTWEITAPDPNGEYWVHEEGFALADGAGRGAQHLWRWDGQTMVMEEETMTSWASLDVGDR